MNIIMDKDADKTRDFRTVGMIVGVHWVGRIWPASSNGRMSGWLNDLEI